MSIHFQHWNNKEKKALSKAMSFKDVAKIYLNVMNHMPKNIHAVSGPMTTGGVGVREDNIKIFKSITEILSEDMKLNIISWIPFEFNIRKLLDKWIETNGKNAYCTPILEEFYRTVYASGKVTKVHFIHGWESSTGARWEHDLCEKLGIERCYLSPELSQKALNRKTTSTKTKVSSHK